MPTKNKFHNVRRIFPSLFPRILPFLSIRNVIQIAILKTGEAVTMKGLVVPEYNVRVHVSFREMNAFHERCQPNCSSNYRIVDVVVGDRKYGTTVQFEAYKSTVIAIDSYCSA